MNRALILVLMLVPIGSVTAQQRRAMQVDDLFRFQRVSDPQISAAGKWVVYSVGNVDLKANKSITNLWLASTEKGGAVKRLTAAAKSDGHPRWSPDSK